MQDIIQEGEGQQRCLEGEEDPEKEKSTKGKPYNLTLKKASLGTP